MSYFALSETELDIMQILWEEEEALSRPEILSKMPDKDWNPNSIHQVLNSMMKKNVLKVAGMVRCGRVYGRTYAPNITRQDLINADVARILPHSTVNEQALGVLAALIDQEDIDVSTLREMEKLLEKRRKELKQNAGNLEAAGN